MLGTWSATPSLDRRLVWYNWLLLAEPDGRDHDGDGLPDNTAGRRYTWRLDLAGLNGTYQDGTGVSPADRLLVRDAHNNRIPSLALPTCP